MRISKALLIFVIIGCASNVVRYHAYIGPEGGRVEGPDNTEFIVPQKALDSLYEIYILDGSQDVKLPQNSTGVYEIGPVGLELGKEGIFEVSRALCKGLEYSRNGKEWVEGQRPESCPDGLECLSIKVLGYVACIGGS